MFGLRLSVQGSRLLGLLRVFEGFEGFKDWVTRGRGGGLCMCLHSVESQGLEFRV